MAVVIVNEIAGADQSFYDEVNPRAMPDGQLPEGCQVHIAGPYEGGWRVITVWDSEEQFQQFRTDKLVPAIQALGRDDVLAPNIQSNSVHRLLTA
jgi:hypothetical protein